MDANREFRWLMALRVVTITALLLAAFAAEVLLRPGETVRPFFVLAALAYGMVLLYAGLDRWVLSRRASVYVQILGDCLLVTAFVRITGGLSSPMSFLYVLPILIAAILLYRGGALATASVCWCLYAALIVWAPTGSSAIGPHGELTTPDPARLGLSLVVHLVAFLTVALLGSNLSERLRASDARVAQQSGTVERLQALTENIIESINSGLLTTDGEGRIRFINRGGTEITGFTADDLEGRSIVDFLGLPDDFLARARRQLRAQRRFRFEEDFERADGRLIFLGTAVSNLYDRQGRPLGFIFIFQDLTEIQALEEEVRLKERMAALGEMAAGMAHELRNPLAAISGSVQYLRGELEPVGESLELMNNVLRESRRLDQAIRDFLTFARPGRFRPEPYDLVKLLEECRALLNNSESFTDAHRVEISAPGGEAWWEIDANRMKQIFWNLATNAVKAMPDGGTLKIDVGASDDGRLMRIAFIDEGGGMGPSEIERYFQPFQGSFQEGTGLGAAIVYRLVQEHQGRVEINSEPGRGTEVRVILPRRGSASVVEASRWPQSQIA